MTANVDVQAIVAAVLEKLKEPAAPKSVYVPPQAKQAKTRMKEVPITAREDPDIDPYKELPEINRETHEYIYCKNGRWRAVPKQTPEQIKERTEKMLESRLRKRAEATKRLEEKLAQIRAEKMEESMVETVAPPRARRSTSRATRETRSSRRSSPTTSPRSSARRAMQQTCQACSASRSRISE